jgi:hemimethylated DNA binding protein
VAERNLEPDTSTAPIRHPLIDQLFDRFEDGRYLRAQGLN